LKLIKAYEEGLLIYYLDETSWNISCVRKYGWEQRGEKVLGGGPPTFQSVTAITTICYNGVGCTEIIRGSIDAAVFESFLHRFLTSIPETTPCAVIMDNASIHHVEAEAILNAAGHNLIYNAAYTPEANPIETVFGVWKERVEKECWKWEGEERFFEVVKDVLLHVEPEEIRRHIERVRSEVWPKIVSKSDL
jgi:transposase